MDTLNQVYSDILTILKRPLVTIKEFDHDSNDVYFTMRNSEDISITLRMKNTLSLIIEKHFVPGKRLFIHFFRSAYDIESNGSNTLDAFYYVKYEEIVDKQDVGFQGSGYPLPMSSDDYNKMYNKGLCCEVESPTNQFQIKQYNLCPEVVRTINTIGTLNECFQSINPVYIGLNFSNIASSEHSIMTFNFNGIFEKTKSTIFDIISRILKILSETGYDLTVDVFEIHQLNYRDLSMRLGTKDEYTVWTRYKLTKHNRLHKGRVIWTEPVVYCPYVPKVFQEKIDYTNNNLKLVYTDYPTANFYQIETLCTIDEFDWWKVIGEEILSMDDVDEAIKFHKQFYPSTQKFRLVKIQKQLLGEL